MLSTVPDRSKYMDFTKRIREAKHRGKNGESASGIYVDVCIYVYIYIYMYLYIYMREKVFLLHNRTDL